jgi:tryptophan-rich sensory protein
MGSNILKTQKNLMKLILSIILCQAVGAIGALFTSSSISIWYSQLVKPKFTPPNWLFAPVWITLYLLMGLSLFLILIKGKEKKLKRTLFIFAIQLFLNGLWSYLFFGLRSPFYGFIEIIVLWIAILFTIVKVFKISKAAAILLIPYIVWVTIAAALNYYILRLNI